MEKQDLNKAGTPSSAALRGCCLSTPNPSGLVSGPVLERAVLCVSAIGRLWRLCGVQL